MIVGIGETEGVADEVVTSKDEVFLKAASKPAGSIMFAVLEVDEVWECFIANKCVS